MKLIITLRDYDIDNIKIDNKKVVKEIIKSTKRFWDCESIEVEE